jgi:hypothetical protein
MAALSAAYGGRNTTISFVLVERGEAFVYKVGRFGHQPISECRNPRVLLEADRADPLPDIDLCHLYAIQSLLRFCRHRRAFSPLKGVIRIG